MKLAINDRCCFFLNQIHEANSMGFASHVIPAPPSKRPIAPEKTAAIEYPQLSVVQKHCCVKEVRKTPMLALRIIIAGSNCFKFFTTTKIYLSSNKKEPPLQAALLNTIYSN